MPAIQPQHDNAQPQHNNAQPLEHPNCEACKRHMHRHGPHPNDVAFVSCMKHAYEDGTQVHICGLDFCAHRGERTVLLGPNGAGKSTLLGHLLGLLRPQEGTVRVFGVDPVSSWHEIRTRIGVVLQDVDRQLIMPTVYDDIAFSYRQYEKDPAREHEAVMRAAEVLSVSHLLKRTPHSLSGGEKRRVALAGALIIDPELLILDEPFEGLDSVARDEIVEVLARLSQRGVTVIMSTHDMNQIAEIADYCYVLKAGGSIALAGTPHEIFENADILRESRINPPLLAELFSKLPNPSGEERAIPLTVDEAVAELTAHE